jgi:hypothetical protein
MIGEERCEIGRGEEEGDKGREARGDEGRRGVQRKRYSRRLKCLSDSKHMLLRPFHFLKIDCFHFFKIDC